MADGTLAGGAPGPVPANEQLTRALTIATDADRTEVYRALLTGSVLVPTRSSAGSPASGPTFLAAQAADGRQILLGFSSAEALRAWPGDARTCTVMTGTELARQARAAGVGGVALDVGGEHPLYLGPTELDQLADGLLPARPGQVRGSVTHATRQVRPSMARWPAGVVALVRDAAADPSVEHAYLFDLAYAGGEPSPAVGFRFGAGGRDAVDRVMVRLADGLRHAVPAGDRVDLVVLDDDLHDAVRGIVQPVA
ncbi:MAG TPA: SseB family protein [Mycobacteriales bacterium]|nr:SseB family protein [Mycobacteriales bacterium]